MSVSPLMFTGVSKYSSDLQTILTRAVGIAKLPITALQNDRQAGLDRKAELMALEPLIQHFQDALLAVTNFGGSSGLSATSDSAKVEVSASSTAQAGVHVISNVSQLAQTAASASLDAYANADTTPIAGSGNYLELWVGADRKTWSLAAGQDNLNSVRDLINASGLGVTASIVSTDAGSVLSVSANDTGAKTIELYNAADKGGSNLLTSIKDGKNLMFNIDGQAVERSSNSVSDVIGGETLTFKDTTAVADKITVATRRSNTPLKNALSSLVSSYTALSNEILKNTGSGGGALVGDSLISVARTALSQVTSFQASSGTIKSLVDLGVTFNQTGVMQFDSTIIDALNTSGLQSAADFLGNKTTGLAQFNDTWNSITYPFTGIISTELAQNSAADARMASQISDMTDRLNTMQASLLSRIQAADAMLSMLETQQSMLTASIDSLSYVAYGKPTSNSGG